jgi:hypothetical protein
MYLVFAIYLPSVYLCSHTCIFRRLASPVGAVYCVETYGFMFQVLFSLHFTYLKLLLIKMFSLMGKIQDRILTGTYGW